MSTIINSPSIEFNITTDGHKNVGKRKFGSKLSNYQETSINAQKHNTPHEMKHQNS
jgi:hypothetical protein